MKQDYPQKTKIAKILKEAFFYWNQTLIYHIVFSLIYFSVSFVVLYYFGMKYGLLQKFQDIFPLAMKNPAAYRTAASEIMQTGEAMMFTYILLAVLAFLYPLNLGLMKMFRKIDLKQKISFEDLFAGYNGTNFFIYASFFLFSYIIFEYAKLLVIPAVLWVFVTLFCAPLMFFMDKRIMESIQLNIKALRGNFITVFVCVLVAILFRYIGIFSIIGALFTFPFWNAMIYAMYKNFFREMD